MTSRRRLPLADRLDDALIQGSVGWFEPFVDPARHSAEEVQAAWRTVERRWDRHPNPEAGPLAAWAKTVGSLKLLRVQALGVLPRLLRVAQPALYDGCAALRILATVPGAAQAMRALLAYGVPVDGEDNGRHTPLMAAAARGMEAHVSLLLTYGANTTLCDSLGWSAADWAGEAGESQALLLLSEAGADVFAVRGDGLHAVDRLKAKRPLRDGLLSVLLSRELEHRMDGAREPTASRRL